MIGRWNVFYTSYKDLRDFTDLYRMGNTDLARGMEQALGAVRLILESRGEPGIAGLLAQARQVLALSAEHDWLVPGDAEGVDLEKFLDLSSDLFCVLHDNFRPLVLNDAWRRMLGYSREELLKRGTTFAVHSDDVSIAADALAQMKATGGAGDFRMRYFGADPSTPFWIHWQGLRDPRTGYIYGIGRDVTAETAANETRDRMVSILQENAAVLEEQAQELNRLRERAERLANYDDLTGLMNRRAWFAQAITSRPTAIAFLDVDYFKQVNDDHGHPVGDAVLVEVARRLREVTGLAGTVGRIGGEEFAIQFHVPFAAARRFCQAAVREMVSRPIEVAPSTRITLSISAGLSIWRRDGATREHSLAATYSAADRALYRAKQSGRSRLEIAPVVGREAA